MFWAPITTGAVSVDTFESFDDGIADSTWENVDFSLSGTPNIVDLGDFVLGSSFLFDTEGSTTLTDTELGGYQADGIFISSDDDGGTGALSSLDLRALGVGDYYLVMGDFNVTFADFAARALGLQGGDFNINLNGGSIAAGTLNAGDLFAVEFSVISAVPEPSSIALIGLVGLGFCMRRRR